MTNTDKIKLIDKIGGDAYEWTTGENHFSDAFWYGIAVAMMSIASCEDD